MEQRHGGLARGGLSELRFTVFALWSLVLLLLSALPGRGFRLTVPTIRSKEASRLQNSASEGLPSPPVSEPSLSLSPLDSVSEIVNEIRSGKRSVEETVRLSLGRISASDLNAFVSVFGEKALREARELDERLRTDPETRNLPLLGVPVAVKDNLCTAGLPTTAGSAVLQNYIPSYDAACVARLKAAGAIVVGKTNMDEFGMGSTTETSPYLQTTNPFDHESSAGGSSGGSAAAVANGEVPLALGSDTGGSIRQPAAWCGLTGLKPTYGRVSRNGLIAYASSTDCVGPIGRTVRDVASCLSVIAGNDPKDSSSLSAPPPDFLKILDDFEKSREWKFGTPLKGLRIGIIAEAMDPVKVPIQPTVEEAVSSALTILKALGATPVKISLPNLSGVCGSYYVTALAEASSNLARYDGMRYGRRETAEMMRTSVGKTRETGLGAEVKKRILIGSFALSAGYSDKYYQTAERVRGVLSEEFRKAFEKADVLICPSAPSTAYPLGLAGQDSIRMYSDDLFFVPASLAGLPALSVPCGLSSNNKPIGLQLIGKPLDEETLLKVGLSFEDAAKWPDQLKSQLESVKRRRASEEDGSKNEEWPEFVSPDKYVAPEGLIEFD